MIKTDLEHFNDKSKDLLLESKTIAELKENANKNILNN